MTQEKLSKMIVMLFESKLKSYTEITVDTWVEMFERKKLPDDKLESAFSKMIYGDDEFPSVGKIVKFCQPDYKQLADDTWTEIMRTVSRGDYKFQGNIKKVLDEIGGARQLADITNFNLQGVKKQFIDKYQKKIETPLMLEGK